MTPEIAMESCTVFLDPERGFERHARIDWPGVEEVLALRSRYATPRKTLSDPRKYVDLTWYEQAAGKG